MQKGQPTGHHPDTVNATRVLFGKQSPFPLTPACSVVGAAWHQTHVRMLGLQASTPKQTERCKRSNYPHCLEEEVSRKVTHWRGLFLREDILPITSLGCPFERGIQRARMRTCLHSGMHPSHARNHQASSRRSMGEVTAHQPGQFPPGSDESAHACSSLAQAH